MQQNMSFHHVYQGNQPNQKQGKRSSKRPLWFILFFFIVLFVAVFLVSPLSKVRSIAVSGASQVAVHDIVANCGVTVGESIWKVHEGAVQSQLMSKFPLIQKVSISTNYMSGHVDVAIAEKSFAAVYISNAKQYRVLNDGTIYDQIELGSNFVRPIISADKMEDVKPGEKLKNSQLVVLSKQVFSLSSTLLQLISEIHVNSDDTWTAFMKDGNEVIMPSGTLDTNLTLYPDFKRQLEEKKQPAGTIHFYDGKPVYHPYDTSTKGNG